MHKWMNRWTSVHREGRQADVRPRSYADPEEPHEGCSAGHLLSCTQLGACGPNARSSHVSGHGPFPGLWLWPASLPFLA